VLTDNGTHFTPPERDEPLWAHAFELACAQADIDHRLTKPKHSWTNGQVERMIRTIKEATVKRFHYETHDQLRGHLGDFIDAYNFARRLKTLNGLAPYEYVCKIWTKEPARFKIDPTPSKSGTRHLDLLIGDIAREFEQRGGKGLRCFDRQEFTAAGDRLPQNLSGAGPAQAFQIGFDRALVGVAA
jgi:hypothetical protein